MTTSTVVSSKINAAICIDIGPIVCCIGTSIQVPLLLLMHQEISDYPTRDFYAQCKLKKLFSQTFLLYGSMYDGM